MTTLAPHRLLAGLSVLLLLTVLSRPTQAEDAEKKAVQVPQPVTNAFRAAYPNATISDISIEKKDGRDYYEIESLDGSVRRDLLYTADGSVFEIEEQISVKDLPRVVADSLSARFPRTELKKAERITRGDTVEYEVLLEDGENNLEVLLDSHGVVKSQVSTKDADESTEGDKNHEEDED